MHYWFASGCITSRDAAMRILIASRGIASPDNHPKTAISG
jgi:hypothetical protein